MSAESHHSRSVLLSARDPGSVGHVVALLSALRSHSGFQPVVVASEPALGMLRGYGIQAEKFESPSSEFALLEAARVLLSRLSPAAVIASLSSFGAGIDEALLAVADVPTFAVQDFWGDVNLTLKRPAELYLVADEFAVELSARRWGVKAVAVGSPKYEAYSALDVASLREEGRKNASLRPGQKLVGLFAQASSVPGHDEALKSFLETLASAEPRSKLLFRGHPKFQEHAGVHLSQARKLGLDVFDATNGGSPERWIASCDLLVTPFSLCAYDHAQLSAFSAVSIGSVLYLNTNPEIRAFEMAACGFVGFPSLKLGLGESVESEAELSHAIKRHLHPDTAKVYFERSKQLRTVVSPCREVISHLRQRLG